MPLNKEHENQTSYKFNNSPIVNKNDFEVK